MLVCSKERYIPVTINTLVLQKNDQYFYVHRDVYDQAVVLADRYNTLGSLQNLIGGSDRNERTIAWFYEHAPKPIHILAPYLSLIDGEINQEMELCCGVLHAITAMIHVRSFVEKPFEVRKSVSFSLTIKEEYEMAWDRFYMTAIPYGQRNVPISVHLPQEETRDEKEEIAFQPPHTHREMDIASTARLDGFSEKKEHIQAIPTKAASDAERKATRRLLT